MGAATRTMAKAAKAKASPKKKAASGKKKAITKEKKPRAPSAYNIFMKKELEKLKSPTPTSTTRSASKWPPATGGSRRSRWSVKVERHLTHSLDRAWFHSVRFCWTDPANNGNSLDLW